MLAADRDHEAVEAARLQHGAQAGEAPGVDRIGGRVGAGHAAFLVPTPLPILPCGGRRSGVVSMAGIWRLAAAIATLLLVPAPPSATKSQPDMTDTTTAHHDAPVHAHPTHPHTPHVTPLSAPRPRLRTDNTPHRPPHDSLSHRTP